MLEVFKKNKAIRIATVTGIVAILCGIAFAVSPAASSVNEKLDNRIALLRNLAKLSIVVMANQTTITADDAKSVLPILKNIRQTGKEINEEQAKNYSEKLHSSFSPSLEKAVSVVRLPDMDSDLKAKLNNPIVREKIHQAIENGRGYGRPDGFKGPGIRAFDKLIAFFEATAAKK